MVGRWGRGSVGVGLFLFVEFYSPGGLIPSNSVQPLGTRLTPGPLKSLAEVEVQSLAPEVYIGTLNNQFKR